MEESKLCYKIGKDEFLSQWLLSDIIEIPFFAEPKPTVWPEYTPGRSTFLKDGKEIVSPAKREYIERGRFAKSGYPENVSIGRLYIPFDTNRVDRADFWDFPTDITFYSRVYLESPKDEMHPFRLFASGALKVWLNGKLEAEFYPYETNVEHCKEILLPLKKGSNELTVGVNDYGERNIQFKFGFQNRGEELEASLPVNVDVDQVKRTMKNLRSLYLDHLSYEEGEIGFCLEHPALETFMFQVKVCGTERTLTLEQGKERVVWGRVEELPMGYHDFEILAETEGVTLSVKVTAEIYPRQKEEDSLQSYEERGRKVLSVVASQPVPSLERCMANLKLGIDDCENCLPALERDLEFVNRRGDCSDFRMLHFQWLLHRFSSVIPSEWVEKLKDTVLHFRYWFEDPGNDAMWFYSENHALAFHISELLAGELYPDEVFPNAGFTGREHKERAKRRLLEWFEKLFRYGYNEWNSASYLNVDMECYITLYELCGDEELRALAGRALDFTFEVYAKNSFGGVLGTSNGRVYTKNLLADRTMSSSSLIWLAFGCGHLNQVLCPAVYLAMSSYRPPVRLEALAKWDQKEKLYLREKQGTYKIETCLCKTKDYMIGSCVSQRAGSLGDQEHLLNIFLAEPVGRIWVNHPGEGTLFGHGRPGYFNGNGLTPLVEQQQNVAVMSYCFPEEMRARTEVSYTHAVCNTEFCDECIVDNNWLFIRKKEAYAALYTTNGLQGSKMPFLRKSEFVSPGINGTWFMKVSCAGEIGSFSEFQSYMKGHIPRIQDGVLWYQDYEFGEMKFTLMENL